MTRDATRFVDRRIDEQTRSSVLGVVTKVIEHTSSDDFSNHEVNVKLANEDEEFRNVPIHVNRNGHIRVPQKGDFVEISFLTSKTQVPYVTGFAYSNERRAPLGRAGHWRHRFGESSPYLYVEAEPSDHSAGTPDVVRLAKKSDGLSDPSTKIELDDSGNTTKVNIETDGDITLSADGDIVIDEGGTATPVAKQDHDHDVTLSDGSTGTTTTPNQSGTNVEIE